MKRSYKIIALMVTFLILLGFFAPWAGFVKAVSTMPTQLTLKNKEAEKLYYFDPLPTFSSPGVLNQIDAIVYRMGETVEGEINETQLSTWYGILRDTLGNNLSVQSLSGGKNFSLVASVAKDGKYFVVVTDSLSSPTWNLSKEIFIKYNVEVTSTDIKPCPTYNCTISGKVTIGNNQPPVSSLTYSIAYPDKKLVSQATGSGVFSLSFPGTSFLGDSSLYISDGYPSVSPDNDAIVYAFIPNYSTITWTLKEIVPQALLYNDEEGNLSQSIVLHLEDSDGKPVSGKADKFYIGMSWISPQVKEISEGVYKIYGGTLKGSSVFFYVKAVINSNTITKTLSKLTYFNPYIEVDAKYSPSPFGVGPYTDTTLGRNIFDAIPLEAGNSLEIKAGVFPIPDIKDSTNPNFTLKDNFYVYRVYTTFSPSIEKHSTSVSDPDLYYVKSASQVSVKISAIVWQRANQDSTATWKSVPPDPYNACCIKNLSQTFYITGTGAPCEFQVLPETFVIGGPQDMSVEVRDSFSIVHVYMVGESGVKLQDSISISYKNGMERKTLTDLWFNPLHVTGTNIPELPVSFSYDDNVDVVYASGKVIFKSVSFNYITNYPMSKNKIVVEIFGKTGDTFPYCGIFEDKVSVTPQIKALSGEYEVVSSSGASKVLTAMLKQSIIITAPFTYKNNFFKVFLNGKPLENYKVQFSYIRTSDDRFVISFDRPIPYDETYSPNKLMVEIEAFSPDLLSEEILSILIPVNKVNKESNLPEINISNPKNNALINTNTIIIEGTVIDDTEVKEFIINGEVVELGGGGTFKKELYLSEGENNITLKATDIFMNEKINSLRIFCDTIPPTYSFAAPAETTKEKITINGTTEKGIKISFRDSELENRNSAFSVEVNLLPGKNYFYFSFEDPAGNKSKTTITIERILVTEVILGIGNPNMYVNSRLMEIDPGRNTVPIIKNGRTLLPIRAVIEALGGYVSWDGTEQKVLIALNTAKIELWIGKNTAKVNGIEKPIDPENPSIIPEIVNSRTMLPIRFIAENLGATVEWDPVKKIVKITFVR